MIGERLLDLRKDADMTQDELAEALKVNKHSISSYEREKSEPPDDIKIKIAEFFGVSVDYLLGITNNPKPYKSNNNYIRLPNDFPEEMMNNLRSYAEYLCYKHRRIKHNSNTE